MSMDNEASFSKIGAFVVLGALLIAGTLAYLGGVRGRNDEFLAETYFFNSVSGLDVGSTVNYRGVKIGKVKKISFIGAEYDDVPLKDGRNIYVLMAMDRKLLRRSRSEDPQTTLQKMIDGGLRATLSASGITGLSHIELNFPKTELSQAHIAWKPRFMLVHPAPSMLESVTDGLTRVLGQVNSMDFSAGWSNILMMTSGASGMFESINSIVESERDRIGRILENLDGTMSTLRSFSESINENPSLLIRSRDAEELPETATK
jgi:ABC-type transporter Mla subunit MlaD